MWWNVTMASYQPNSRRGFLAFSLIFPLLHTMAQGAAGPAAPENHRHKIAFDVISVVQNNSGRTKAKMGLTQDAFTARNVNVHMLLTAAFHVFDNQLIAEPKWTTTDRWDIQAKVASEDLSSFQQLTFVDRLDMFQDILRDRFGLRVHHETRDLPIYALVIANGGPKITKSKTQSEIAVGIKDAPGMLTGQEGKEVAQGALIRYLCEDLQDYVGRPIVDRTGLTGRYDFTLQWSPDDDLATNPSPSTMPSLFTALQEQLGLKLEPRKAPLDVIVIDALEKPEAN